MNHVSVVMNVFIAIIEEAYITIKMKNKNHWIYMYLKLDNQYVELRDGKKKTQMVSQIEEVSVEETVRRSSREDEFNYETAAALNLQENKENTYRGLDYFYYKLDEELIQIKKIMEESSKIEDKETREDIRKYHNMKISEFEIRLKTLKEAK